MKKIKILEITSFARNLGFAPTHRMYTCPAANPCHIYIRRRPSRFLYLATSWLSNFLKAYRRDTLASPRAFGLCTRLPEIILVDRYAILFSFLRKLDIFRPAGKSRKKILASRPGATNFTNFHSFHFFFSEFYDLFHLFAAFKSFCVEMLIYSKTFHGESLSNVVKRRKCGG